MSENCSNGEMQTIDQTLEEECKQTEDDKKNVKDDVCTGAGVGARHDVGGGVEHDQAGARLWANKVLAATTLSAIVRKKVLNDDVSLFLISQ